MATSRLTWSVKPTVDLDEFDLVEIPKYFTYLFLRKMDQGESRKRRAPITVLSVRFFHSYKGRNEESYFRLHAIKSYEIRLE